jgi:hypothetical protein
MRHSARILSISILVALSAVAIAKPKPKPAADAAPAAAASSPAAGTAGTTQATAYKDNVAVHQAALSTSPTVTSLAKGSPVEVEKQEGLWFNVKAQASATGYVKINEVRLAKAAGGSNDGYSMFGGHPKASETAGVRGLNTEELGRATFDAGQLARMEGLRVDDNAANAYASRMHLQKTAVAYAKEPGIGQGHRATSGTPEETQAKAQENTAVKKGLFGMVGSKLPGGMGASAGSAADAMPKSEQEKYDEEVAMGPQLAGRVLSVMPVWDNPEAQRRVNTIGRWVALQTPRDDLPWTFAVVDSPTMNAFAAPGGYILVTRGLYEVLQSDDEVAATLAHEISHVVSRDHYNVIRKQAMAGIATSIVSDKISSQAGKAGGPFAQHLAGYFAKEGAKIILVGFDKDVEFRSDMASLIYTARAGYNPLAMYAVLQKLSAVSDGGRTSNLYSTHPAPSARLDKLDKGLQGVAQYTDRPYVAAMR